MVLICSLKNCFLKRFMHLWKTHLHQIYTYLSKTYAAKTELRKKGHLLPEHWTVDFIALIHQDKVKFKIQKYTLKLVSYQSWWQHREMYITVGTRLEKLDQDNRLCNIWRKQWKVSDHVNHFARRHADKKSCILKNRWTKPGKDHLITQNGCFLAGTHTSPLRQWQVWDDYEHVHHVYECVHHMYKLVTIMCVIQMLH